MHKLSTNIVHYWIKIDKKQANNGVEIFVSNVAGKCWQQTLVNDHNIVVEIITTI